MHAPVLRIRKTAGTAASDANAPNGQIRRQNGRYRNKEMMITRIKTTVAVVRVTLKKSTIPKRNSRPKEASKAASIKVPNTNSRMVIIRNFRWGTYFGTGIR
jgi:hypothetical protein